MKVYNTSNTTNNTNNLSEHGLLTTKFAVLFLIKLMKIPRFAIAGKAQSLKLNIN